MRAENPIISHPEWQSMTQRLTSGTLTLIAWAIWMYLWIPLITAILWLAGIHLIYTELVQNLSLNSVWFIMSIALTCSIVVASWASYNYMRYAPKSRRRGAEVVSHEEIGKQFRVSDAATLSLLSRERRINLHFDEDGVLVRAEALGTQDNIVNLVLEQTSSERVTEG